MSPFVHHVGLFADSYFRRVLADPNGPCPRVHIEDIDGRLARLVEIWNRYRDSLVRPVGAQQALFGGAVHFDGLPAGLRPLPSQEKVTEGFVELVLDEVCGYAIDRQSITDPDSQATLIPDFLCFSSGPARDTAKRSLGARTPSAREYCRDVVLVVDAKRFAKGVGAEEGGDDEGRADRRSKRGRKEPTAADDIDQVLQYLRATGKRWGVLTNGRCWRLMESGRDQPFVRFDVITFAESLRGRGGVFTADDRETLSVFLHLFGPPATSGGYLDDLARASEAETRHVRDVLRDQAHRAVSLVANGLLLHPANGFVVKLAEGPREPAQAFLDHVRELSLAFLYRLLFVLKAEAQNLLPMRDRNGAPTPYARCASIQAIFGAVSVLSEHDRTTAALGFRMLVELFTLVDRGGEYGVPPYDGGLFSKSVYPELERLRFHDDIVHEVLVALLYLEEPEPTGKGTPSHAHRALVPYADLDVRDLGDIYEGLLELRLVRAEEVALAGASVWDMPFVLRNQNGEKKASGSYFTQDAIVDHLVRRTLHPLLEECGGDAMRVLSLKVVDPAMGSGHFLVKAVDVIAQYLTRECDPVDTGVVADNGPHERAYWKRKVVERCIYGVDVNPMAVELAKVALWLHTASAGKPLSFLDHHLKCGNSLVGARLSRMNVPALKLESSKKVATWKPRTAEPAVAKRGRGGPAPQRALELDLDQGFVLDVLASIRDVLSAPADTPAEVHAKAEAYRTNVEERLECHRLLADLWCAQWFLAQPGELGHHAYEDPNGPFERVRNACIASGPAAAHRRQEVLDAVADESIVRAVRRAREEGYGPRLLRFFHWELEFPEVAFDADGRLKPSFGFDAVVGNPPWDKLKPAKRDYYGRFSEGVANTQGPSLDRLIATLEKARPELRKGWETYERGIEALTSFLQGGGDYVHQVTTVAGRRTGGDPDLFRYFIERAHQLARARMRIGQVVPCTLWQAEGCTGLRKLLLERCAIESLYTFENYRKWAFDIHSSFKFTVFVLAATEPEPGRTFPAAFMLRGPRVLEGGDRDRVVEMSREIVEAVSPETLALLDIKHGLEARIVRKLHLDHPALGSEASGWNVRYGNELHMTNDAWLFRSRDWMRERGFTQIVPARDADGGWTQRREGPGEVAGLPPRLLPGGEYWMAASESFYRKRGYAERSGDLDGSTKHWFVHPSDVGKTEERGRIFPLERYTALYEGRMVHNFDHAQKAYVSGEGRRAVWVDLGIDEKRLTPRMFVCPAEAGIDAPVRCGFCDVTGATNERTALATLVPPGCLAGNTVPVLKRADEGRAAMVAALIGSFVADALLRLRVSTHLNWTYVCALRVPSFPEINKRTGRRLDELVARLACTTPELAITWNEIFPQGKWSYRSAERDPWKRAELRAEIDAIVAELYGLSVEEYAYVLTTFPLLDRDQPPLPGDRFATDGTDESRGDIESRGDTWDETDEGIVELQPRSFVTRDLALLRYMERKRHPVPQDLEAFYRDTVGLDPSGPLSRFRVGAVRDLEARVAEARKLGAVAYVPSGRGGPAEA